MQDLHLSRTLLKVLDALQLGKLGWKFIRLQVVGCFELLADHDRVQAMRYPAAGEWPELKVLDVSDNSLSATGVAQLVKADWRALQSLDISNQSHGGEITDLLGSWVKRSGQLCSTST